MSGMNLTNNYEIDEISKLNDIADAIKESRKIAIFAHENPDGDAYASSVGVGMALRKMGYDVKFYLGHSKQDFSHIIGMKEAFEENYEPVEEGTTALCLDCASRDYAANNELFEKCERLIVVDHHATNTFYGDINYVDTTAAACAEISYFLIKAMGCEITGDIAYALYLGLVTDTGSFQYSNTTFRTHFVAGTLAMIRRDFYKLHDELKYISRNEFLALSEAMNNTDFLYDGALGIMSLTKDDESYWNNHIDTDGFVDHVRDIYGIRLAVFTKEISENVHKVSMRAMDDKMNVSDFAARNGGGGHPKAAGFTYEGDIEELHIMIAEYYKDEWTE